jgi:hypothetical protein
VADLRGVGEGQVMATAAGKIMGKKIRRVKPRFVVIEGNRVLDETEAVAWSIGVNQRFEARALRRRLERTIERHKDAPDRQSVAVAMLAVEEKIVAALWTIARQPLGKVAPMLLGRCGIEYVHDRTDVHSIYSDAAGGKWDTAAPRPSLPSAKDISEADRVQDWLLLVDDESMRKLLVMGATSKRGDAGRRIPWPRLRPSLPEYKGSTIRTMQRRYDEALRIIVTELTIARMSSLSHKRA